MNILHISDTFGRHAELKNLPAADVLVHTGNFTAHGKRDEVYDFIAWLQQQNYKHKIFIAGDRDRWLYCNEPEILAENCHYLRYSAVIINGVRFYGAPMFAEDIANGFFRKALDKIPRIPRGVDVVTGIGSNTEISAGQFRVTIIAAYDYGSMKKVGCKSER